MSNSYVEELKRKSANALQERIEQVEKSNEKKSYVDERFWKASLDKSGNGGALIRFLPPIQGENTPFVHKYVHIFKGDSGKWLAENCLSTIKKTCPICESNTEKYKALGKEEYRNLYGSRNRQLKYFSNILVVEDTANPENNGKVFLYEYGVKIFTKIKEAMKPISSRKKPFDPFDAFTGANFELVVKRVAGQTNYDSSSFEKQSEITDDMDELGTILDGLYSLDAIISLDNFKSEEEIERVLMRVNSKKFVSRESESEASEEDLMDKYRTTKKEDESDDISPSDISLDDLPF